MAKLSHREMSYALAEPLSTKWYSENCPEAISLTASTVTVDFQRRTVILPEGKFDLDNFLRIAKDICLRLS